MDRSLHLGCLLVLIPTSSGVARPAAALTGPQRAEPLAPDGHRGLGGDTPKAELLELFRSRGQAEREFLGALSALSSEVRVLLATTEESYRSAGYFELLGRDRDQDLDLLHSAWRAGLADPRALLAEDDPRARTFARLLLDPRFQVRAQLCEGIDLDAREIDAGLSVLEGNAESYVDLGPEEVRAVALRVDLAASRLRARRSDLLALRQTGTRPRESERGGEEITALLAAARAEDPAIARAAVAEIVDRSRERAARMRSALFSTRLEPILAELESWRGRLLSQAGALRADALVYLPDSQEGRAAPSEILALKKHERLRLAWMRASQGLALDPLDAELSWICAHAADFQWGNLESRPWYDRFLFLRGIRHYDHRTLAGRRLDERESEALEAVQRTEVPAPPPRKDG